MKINASILFLIVVVLTSCNSSSTIFEESLPDGQIQFLLVPLSVNEADSSNNELPTAFKRGFQIDHKKGIQSLYNMKPQATVKSMPIPHYIGVFTKNGEIISNFFVNEELTELHTSKGNFQIATHEFLDNSEHMSELETVTTLAEDKEAALELRKVLHENGVFMELLGDNPDEPAWSKFDGKMVIGLAQSIQEKKDIERVEKKLAACMGNCKVTDISTRDGFTTCEVYCNGLKEQLPSDYRLVSDYKEFSEIEIVSLGTDKESIQEIITKNGLKKVSLQ